MDLLLKWTLVDSTIIIIEQQRFVSKKSTSHGRTISKLDAQVWVVDLFTENFCVLILEIHLTTTHLIGIGYSHNLVKLHIVPIIAVLRLYTWKRKLGAPTTVILQQNSLHLAQGHFFVILIFEFWREEWCILKIVLFAGVFRRILLNKGQLTSIEFWNDARLLKYVLTVILTATLEILNHVLQLFDLQLYVRSLSYLIQVTACSYVTAVESSALLPVNHLQEKTFNLFHSTVIHLSDFHLLVLQHFVLVCLPQYLLLLSFE